MYRCEGREDYCTKGHLIDETEQPGGKTYHLDSHDAYTDSTRLSEYYG